MSAPAAGIFGVAGLALSETEKEFFRALNPLGYILFARNCDNPAQVMALVTTLKSLSGRSDVLILIDQEGGRVARLKPPHWRKSPAAGEFAKLAAHDAAAGHTLARAGETVYRNARLIAAELYALGINVDCAPLADVPVDGAHDIIGDRAYGSKPHQIAALAAEMARGLTDGGVLPVLKHIPGHGRAMADSHEELPTVTASLEELRKSDFLPFIDLANIPLGMTAHIVYTAIDAERPATLSPAVIRLVREELGFDGLLMSDDLSMKALKGSFSERTLQSLSAGCDIVLHCNGDMREMKDIASVLPPLGAEGQRRFYVAVSRLHAPRPFDISAAQEAIADALALEQA